MCGREIRAGMRASGTARILRRPSSYGVPGHGGRYLLPGKSAKRQSDHIDFNVKENIPRGSVMLMPAVRGTPCMFLARCKTLCTRTARCLLRCFKIHPSSCSVSHRAGCYSGPYVLFPFLKNSDFSGIWSLSILHSVQYARPDWEGKHSLRYHLHLIPEPQVPSDAVFFTYDNSQQVRRDNDNVEGMVTNDHLKFSVTAIRDEDLYGVVSLKEFTTLAPALYRRKVEEICYSFNAMQSHMGACK